MVLPTTIKVTITSETRSTSTLATQAMIMVADIIRATVITVTIVLHPTQDPEAREISEAVATTSSRDTTMMKKVQIVIASTFQESLETKTTIRGRSMEKCKGLDTSKATRANVATARRATPNQVLKSMIEKVLTATVKDQEGTSTANTKGCTSQKAALTLSRCTRPTPKSRPINIKIIRLLILILFPQMANKAPRNVRARTILSFRLPIW